MRMVAVILVGILGVALVVVSLGPLSNLFSQYQDSQVSTYLVLGLPPFALGMFCLIVAGRELTRR
jgi:hypothetical protein